MRVLQHEGPASRRAPAATPRRRWHRLGARPVRSHATAQIEIDRPVAQVFKWLAEPDRAARWQPDVVGYEITGRTNGVLGTEFVETLAKGGRSAQLRGRIVEFEPDALIAFALSGAGLEIAATYGARSTATGTIVRADITIDTAARLPALLRPAVEWQIRRQLRRELNGLRRLCDTERFIDTKEGSDA